MSSSPWLPDVGHSSGTQVAAHAAHTRPDAARTLVLPVTGVRGASPTVDPVERSWPRLIARWRLDGRHEPPGSPTRTGRSGAAPVYPGSSTSSGSTWSNRLEQVMPLLPMPVLVLRGRDDQLLTPEWAAELTRLVRCGRLEEMPGAHAFPWKDEGFRDVFAWTPSLCR